MFQMVLIFRYFGNPIIWEQRRVEGSGVWRDHEYPGFTCINIVIRLKRNSGKVIELIRKICCLDAH